MILIPSPNAQGRPNAQTGEVVLVGYEDHLVRITGQCELVDGALTEDCDLSRVQILGNAGQGGVPGNSGNADASGLESDGPSGQANKPEGTGPPENQSRPESPGNSGNSKPKD